MSFHKIIEFSIFTLTTLIQIKFHSKSYSPFDTQYGIMVAFVVALLTFVLAWAIETFIINDNIHNSNMNNDDEVRRSVWVSIRKMRVLFGSVAAILLLCIIFPFAGWLCLLFWTILFVKTSYEVVKDVNLVKVYGLWRWNLHNPCTMTLLPSVEVVISSI
ncbi:hypothetical protein CsatA_023956 [Cannabis sativa]